MMTFKFIEVTERILNVKPEDLGSIHNDMTLDKDQFTF